MGVYKMSISNDVLCCLNVDIKYIGLIIEYKIQLKCELLVSKDIFGLHLFYYNMSIKYVEKTLFY